jgi:hypothetical protein
VINDYQKAKRKATTFHVCTTNESIQVPIEFKRMVKWFQEISEKRDVVAFDLKVWVKPRDRDRDVMRP